MYPFLSVAVYISVYEYVCVLVAQSCPTLCDPVDCSRQASLFMGFSSKNTGVVCCFPSPEDLPHPGLTPWSPALQADSLPCELFIHASVNGPLGCSHLFLAVVKNNALNISEPVCVDMFSFLLK